MAESENMRLAPEYAEQEGSLIIRPYVLMWSMEHETNSEGFVRPYNFVEIYLSEEIHEPIYYVDLFNVLRSLEDGDKVTIYINSPGGDFETMNQFVNIMNGCKAEITTIVEGSAFSAAAIIWINGDILEMNEYAGVMFHPVQGNLQGALTSIPKTIEFTQRIYRKHFENRARIILSQEEIDKIMTEDSTLWITSDELYERIEKYSGVDLDKLSDCDVKDSE